MSKIRQVNVVMLEGNLTRDPEGRTTSDSKLVVKFSIANNQNEKVNYITCKAWDKLGELVTRFAQKGTHVLVEGRYVDARYEHEGKTVYAVEIVAESIRFLGNLKEKDAEQGAAPSATQATQPQTTKYSVQGQADVFVTSDFKVVNGAGLLYQNLRVDRATNAVLDDKNQFYGTANIPVAPPVQTAPAPQVVAPQAAAPSVVAPQAQPSVMQPQAQPSVAGIGNSTTGFTAQETPVYTPGADDDIPF